MTGTPVRNPTIDAAKGALLLLVIVGHLPDISVRALSWKWMLYGFHMPLFLGLSGFLVNPEKVRSLTAGSFLRTYWKRMLLAWTVAWVAYTTVRLNYHGRISPKDIFKAAVWPFYHLWYVQALFGYLCLLWAVRVPVKWLAVAALGVAVAAAVATEGVVPGVPPGWLRSHGVPGSVATLVGDRRNALYGFFFFRGVVVRSAPVPVPSAVLAAAAGVGLIGWAVAYPYGRPAVELLSLVVLNSALIGALPRALKGSVIDVPWVNAIGRNSLYYYLWHPAFVFAAREVIAPPRMSEEASYAITFVGMMAGLWAIARLSERSAGLSVLFGYTRSDRSVPS